MTTLLSVMESPTHPDFSALYARVGIEEERVGSMRKAIAAVKRAPPDIVVAEFFYGWGNNYAGVNISNVDVLLHTLNRYAPQARVILMVERGERRYVDALNSIHPLASVLVHPVDEAAMESAFRAG